MFWLKAMGLAIALVAVGNLMVLSYSERFRANGDKEYMKRGTRTESDLYQECPYDQLAKKSAYTFASVMLGICLLLGGPVWVLNPDRSPLALPLPFLVFGFMAWFQYKDSKGMYHALRTDGLEVGRGREYQFVPYGAIDWAGPVPDNAVSESLRKQYRYRGEQGWYPPRTFLVRHQKWQRWMVIYRGRSYNQAMVFYPSREFEQRLRQELTQRGLSIM